MNFRNILWTYAPKQDGSCDIKLYFNHLGKKKYFSTGIKIEPKYWNKEKGIVKKTHPQATRYNAKLKKLKFDIESHFLDGGNWLNLFKENSNKNNLIDFIEQIIKDGDNGLLSITDGTLKCYKATLTRLKQFKKLSGIETTLEGMDMAFYNDFTAFLPEHGNCNSPGINKHVKILKRVMNIGIEKGLHENDVHMKKGFKRQRITTTAKIYLTEHEINRLEKMNFKSKPFLQKELDRWLVAYYLLLRFSDVIRMSEDNVREVKGKLFYTYVSLKTSTPVNIPIRDKALKLMKKYDYDFSWGGNQQANRQIKAAIAAAGINSMIDTGDMPVPKSSLVTTHTARRSGATNLYLSGQFSIKTIADLGGWEGVEMLQVYLKCSNMDSAKMAAESDYFR